MRSKEIYEMQAYMFKALGHVNRVEIVHALRDGPRSVFGMAEAIGIRQAILSYHLNAMRQVGLVTVERQGSEQIYQLASPKVGMVCDLMRQVMAEQITHQAEVADDLVKRA